MLLRAAGAEYGAHHQDHLDLDVKKEATVISESTIQTNGAHHQDRLDLDAKKKEKEATVLTDPTIQTIGLISGLLFTVCFAAAFAMPGGYRAGDETMAGMPVLATRALRFPGFRRRQQPSAALLRPGHRMPRVRRDDQERDCLRHLHVPHSLLIPEPGSRICVRYGRGAFAGCSRYCSPDMDWYDIDLH
jgi:hypothetical protein